MTETVAGSQTSARKLIRPVQRRTVYDPVSPGTSTEVAEELHVWRRGRIATVVLTACAVVACAEVVRPRLSRVASDDGYTELAAGGEEPAIHRLGSRAFLHGKFKCGMVEEDMDYSTHEQDLAAIGNVASADACSQRCLKHDNCALWTWGKTSKRCYLKELPQGGSPTRIPRAGVISGGRVDEGVEYRTDQPVVRSIPNVLTAEACSLHCSAEPRCDVWTWGAAAGVRFLSRVCFLRSVGAHGVPSPVQRRGVVSGGMPCARPPASTTSGPSAAGSQRGTPSKRKAVKGTKAAKAAKAVKAAKARMPSAVPPTEAESQAVSIGLGDRIYMNGRFVCGMVEHDMDYWTTLPVLYELPGIPSASACSQRCAREQRCTVWTWGEVRGVPFLSDVCFLKQLFFGEVPIRIQKTGVVSGGRVEENMDYWTKQRTIRKIQHVLSADACSRHCSSESACTLWTWGEQQGVPFLSNVCFLKHAGDDEFPMRVVKQCVVSGGMPCDVYELLPNPHPTKETQSEDGHGTSPALVPVPASTPTQEHSTVTAIPPRVVAVNPVATAATTYAPTLVEQDQKIIPATRSQPPQTALSGPSAEIMSSKALAGVPLDSHGVIPFVLVEDNVIYWTHRPAVDIVPSVTSPSECSKLCMAQPPCMVWSLSTDSDICFLQELEEGEAPSRREKPGYVSGQLPPLLKGRRPAQVAAGKSGEVLGCGLVEDGVLFLTRRPAMEVARGVRSADVCGQLCAAKPPCAVWTLGSSHHICFLQELEEGELPSRQQRQGFTSGSRACSVHSSTALQSVESQLLGGTSAESEGHTGSMKCGLVEDETLYLTRQPALNMTAHVPSPAVCGAMCFKNNLCMAWTYGEQTGMCFLQKLKESEWPSRQSRQGFISGSRPCSLDRPGGTAAGSGAAGTEEAGTLAVSSTATRVANRVDRCGQVRHGVFYLTESPAVEMFAHIGSWHACSRLCAKEPRCSQWSMDDSRQTCFLQELQAGEMPTARKEAGFTSGTPPCTGDGEAESDDPDGDKLKGEAMLPAKGDEHRAEQEAAGSVPCGIFKQDSIYLTTQAALSMLPQVQAPSHCSRLCFQEKRCDSWTWGQDTGVCFLQTLREGEQPSIRHRNGHVSGSRPCSEEGEAVPTGVRGGADTEAEAEADVDGGRRGRQHRGLPASEDEETWSSHEASRDGDTDSDEGDGGRDDGSEDDGSEDDGSEGYDDEGEEHGSKYESGADGEEEEDNDGPEQSCDLVEEGIDYWTKQAAVAKIPRISSTTRCAHLCAEESRCSVWALDHDRHLCFLEELELDEKPVRRKRRGYASGNLPCNLDDDANSDGKEGDEENEDEGLGCGLIEVDVDYWTKMPAIDKVPNIGSAPACAELCAGDERCSAWALDTRRSLCFLQELEQGEWPSRRKRRGYTSGSLPCNPPPASALPLNGTANGSGNVTVSGSGGSSSDAMRGSDADRESVEPAPAHWVPAGANGSTPAGEGAANSTPTLPPPFLGVPGVITCGLVENNTIYSTRLPAVDRVENVTSADECSSLCLEEPHCMAWTLEVSTSMCYLQELKQDELPIRRKMRGYISGGLKCRQRYVRPAGSLYCFALMKPFGYEKALLKMQHNLSTSLFGCDEYAIYSNTSVEIAPGIRTHIINGSLECAAGGEFQTALNRDIFLKVWQQVFAEGRYLQHNWTIKVDPDTVFFPDLLRDVLPHHQEAPGGVYLNNCKHGLHGPIEVFSRNAVTLWHQGLEKCQRHFDELCSGFCGWGEDMYVDQCLWKVLGARRDNEWALLTEHNCPMDPSHVPDWSPSLCANGDIAFHPFKTQEGYMECLNTAAKQNIDIAFK